MRKQIGSNAKKPILCGYLIGIAVSLGAVSSMPVHAMPQDSTVYYRFAGSFAGNITRAIVGMGPTSPASIYEFNSLVYSNGSPVNVDPLIRPAGSLTNLYPNSSGGMEHYRDRGGAEWIQSNMTILRTTNFIWPTGGDHGDDTPGAGLFRRSEYTGASNFRGWTRIRFNPGATKSSVSQPFAVRRTTIPIGSYPEGVLRDEPNTWSTKIPLAEMGTTADRLLFLEALHITDPDLGSGRRPFNQAANGSSGSLASAFSVRGANGGNFTFDLSRGNNNNGDLYDLNRGWITAEYRSADCADGLGSVLTSSTNVGSRTISAFTWGGTDYVSSSAYAGCNGEKNGTYVFESTGDDIWNTSDTFRFGHRSGSGNKEIRVRIDQLENTNAWARAGIMIRQSTAANSRYAAVFLTPGNGITFQARHASTGTNTIGSASNAITKAPVWLRLRYDDVNDVTRAYYSTNGSTWVQVSSNFLIADFSNHQMGLATASRSSYPHTTVFSGFSYSNTLSPP